MYILLKPIVTQLQVIPSPQLPERVSMYHLWLADAHSTAILCLTPPPKSVVEVPDWHYTSGDGPKVHQCKYANQRETR